MMQRILLSLFVGGIAFSLTGCGGERNPGTVPVSLTFTKKGQPVVGATVALIPADSAGKGASGLTDSSGVVVLETPPKWKGAMPGEYVVTVKLFEKYEYHYPMPGFPDNMAFGHRNALPEKYASHTTSDFKLTVGKKATQATFDIPE